MKKSSIYWNRSYGWRSGSPCIEPGATAADVIRFERNEYGNDLDAPDFLLEELDRRNYRAADTVWVCRTLHDARRYSGSSIGQPYREEFGADALILATDHEQETGYLILRDGSRLDPAILEHYTQYREKQHFQNMVTRQRKQGKSRE